MFITEIVGVGVGVGIVAGLAFLVVADSGSL